MYEEAEKLCFIKNRKVMELSIEEFELMEAYFTGELSEAGRES